jgi:hypothetical protein
MDTNTKGDTMQTTTTKDRKPTIAEATKEVARLRAGRDGMVRLRNTATRAVTVWNRELHAAETRLKAALLRKEPRTKQ